MSNITIEDLSVTRIDISTDGTHDAEYVTQEFAVAPNGDIIFTGVDNVIDGSGPGREQYYIKDFDTGAITMFSTNSSGTPGDRLINGQIYDSNQGLFTSDSNKVVFVSEANNFDPADLDTQSGDVFIKDLTTGAIELVSLNPANGGGYDTGTSPTFSPDGNIVGYHVASAYTIKNLSANTYTTPGSSNNWFEMQFTSDSSKILLQSSFGSHVTGDTNNALDVFFYDIASGTYERISTDSAGNQANGASGSAFLSPDGNYVYFGSSATNLVAGDTNGIADTFRKNLTTGEVTRISTDTDGVQIGFQLNPVDISPDGTKVLFYNYISGHTAFFIKDLASGELTGYTINGYNSYYLHDKTPTFSPDGSQVYFLTNWGFASDDTNGLNDIYAFDISGANVIVAANCEPVVGTADIDRVTVSDNHSYDISVLAGDDQVTGGVGHDTIDAGADNDTVYGGEGHDSIDGGSGDDELRGMEGHDTINGGDGNDLIYAGIEAQRDTIDGGAGDDTIHAGGAGDDLLTGGSGADVFMFMAAGTEATILDYVDGVDKIDVSDFAVGLSMINITFYDDQLSGLTAQVTNGADEMHIHLSGYSVATNPLDATDFIFS